MPTTIQSGLPKQTYGNDSAGLNQFAVSGKIGYIFPKYHGESYAICVDSADLPLLLEQGRWRIRKDSHGHAYYAVVTTGHHSDVSMHRLLLNPMPQFQGDHINGDGLDNRRANLRSITNAHNVMNQRRRAPSRSGLRGVTPRGKKWRASVMVSGKRILLGDHVTAELASSAVQSYLRELGV